MFDFSFSQRHWCIVKCSGIRLHLFWYTFFEVVGKGFAPVFGVVQWVWDRKLIWQASNYLNVNIGFRGRLQYLHVGTFQINFQDLGYLSRLVTRLRAGPSWFESRHMQQILLSFLTFCWPCISVYLSQYLTNLMHKICFTISFISCLYMFRAHVLIIRMSKLHYVASDIITPIGGLLVH